jgi:two-component system response regulator LytT
MRLLILEDEAPTATQIRRFAARYGLPTDDVHEVRSVAKALCWFAEHPMPALIFSDIELLDGNVFHLYEQVAVTCPIIFLTAYDQFYQAAFQASGIGYLLKPFTYAQFAAALVKYEQLHASFARDAGPAPAWPADALAQLRAALQPVPVGPAYRQRLSVRQPNNGFYLLPVGEVTHLQTEDGLLGAYDRRGGRHLLTGTLAEWEQQLDPARFFRLNRSTLVHLPAVERVEPYVNNRLAVYLPTGATLVSSSAQTAPFRRWLET